ncbi:hypothetical protein AE1304_26410 [Aeromonas enteropelogenes]
MVCPWGVVEQGNFAELAWLMYSPMGDGKQPVPAECFALGKFRHCLATFGWLFLFQTDGVRVAWGFE